MAKVLITVADKMVAPRFDLATEVMVVDVDDKTPSSPPRFILMPGPSADELCGLVMKENINCLVCGGIEDEHYQFLVWKKVQVYDRVIGEHQHVLQAYLEDNLHENAVVGKPASRRRKKSK